jgi:hypothetical protein
VTFSDVCADHTSSSQEALGLGGFDQRRGKCELIVINVNTINHHQELILMSSGFNTDKEMME